MESTEGYSTYYIAITLPKGTTRFFHSICLDKLMVNQNFVGLHSTPLYFCENKHFQEFLLKFQPEFKSNAAWLCLLKRVKIVKKSKN